MAELPAGLDLPADHAAALRTKNLSKKNANLVRSDQLMFFIAQIISANLLNWGMVLVPPGNHGKGRFIEKLVDFIDLHDHPLLQCRKTTSLAVSIWIKNGKKLAVTEQALRYEIA